MNTLKGFAPALLLTFFAFPLTAQAQTPAAETDAPAPQESLAPTGSGTAGKIAKWTTSTNLGNSVITENSARIGVNVAAPTARLHVFGATPPAKATNGTNATLLLYTSGGKGGATTVAGYTAGKGADILLQAGPGGDAVAGSYPGRGGDIVLRPGAPGAGGYGNAPGNVLIAPSGVARVGIGTNTPSFKLHVDGGSGAAVVGFSTNSNGVYGQSGGGTGVTGFSTDSYGVYGISYNGYAGFFDGKAKVTGNLEVASCTGCSPPSDRSLKTNISAVNPRLILDKLATVPVQTWRYKTEPEEVRHVGPMAQDFHAAFGLGESDRTLNTVDAQGVTMASVQALYQLMLERDRQVQRMMLEKDRQNQELNRKVERLQAQLTQVRRAVRSRAARR